MIIYKTTNLINNKFYIGQDFNDNPKYYGSGKLITFAIKKYGKENFKKEIIEYCTDEKHMDEREIFWIKELNATNKKIAYNICEGGKTYRTMKGENHPFFGKHHTEETRAIIKEKRKLQKMSNFEKERLRKLWKTNANPGKNKSNETIEKIKNAAKELDRYGEKSTFYGKTHSEETKKHWSEIRKGKNVGINNPAATRYYIETPDKKELIFNSRKEVIEYIGCSMGFFTLKKYKGYKLIRKEIINKKEIIINKEDDEYYIYTIESPNGEILIFNKKSEIIKKLDCSLYFFICKHFLGYKLIKREKNNL